MTVSQLLFGGLVGSDAVIAGSLGIVSMGFHSLLQRPRLSIFFVEKPVCFRFVHGAQVVRVPMKGSARPVGDVAEEHGLGQGAAVTKVARRRSPGLAGFYPFAV